MYICEPWPYVSVIWIGDSRQILQREIFFFRSVTCETVCCLWLRLEGTTFVGKKFIFIISDGWITPRV